MVVTEAIVNSRATAISVYIEQINKVLIKYPRGTNVYSELPKTELTPTEINLVGELFRDSGWEIDIQIQHTQNPRYGNDRSYDTISWVTFTATIPS